jgi:hypothetical protein
MAGLLRQPLHHSRDVVAVRHVVAERREAVRFAALFHFGQLFQVKFLLFNGAPVEFCVVHREARSERAVGADDQPVLAGAAAPVLARTTHETLHILEPGNGEGQIRLAFTCLWIRGPDHIKGQTI